MEEQIWELCAPGVSVNVRTRLQYTHSVLARYLYNNVYFAYLSAL